MIGIRSITYHLPENYNENDLEIISKISREWATRYSLIRTQRVVLVPYTEPASMDRFIKLSKICDTSEIRWFNVPIDPWKSNKKDELFKFAENILNNYGRAFVNVLAFQNGNADTKIMNLSANLIRRTSIMSKNGKDNFRLGLSVNVLANGAFFPFTMSSGDFSFSIALELTQEINKICDIYHKLSIIELREVLKEELEKQIEVIENIAIQIESEFGLCFNGFDFSIAPIISEDGSIITILHRLGVYNFGKTGTLFATAFLTDLIKSFRDNFKSIGFSGVMYSLLEDLELCMINNERGVTLEELIDLSTVCGCGVDMVPVYGDITNHEMLSIFMDVFSISTRLNKPLGIRILPIPYCKKNQLQYTNLFDDADFIANTKIVNMDLNITPNLGETYNFLKTYCMKID